MIIFVMVDRKIVADTQHLTDIAGRLHRDRSAVKRDVDQLAQVGLVTVETKTLLGHDHMHKFERLQEFSALKRW